MRTVDQIIKDRYKLSSNPNLSLRQDTMDEYVMLESEYDGCNFSKDDIWLDIGANIGAFPMKFAHRVKQIYSFEPEPDNFNLLEHHVKINSIDNVDIFNYALVEDDTPTKTFYVNSKKNKGAHSLIKFRGRDQITINCDNINNWIHKVNKIKMDIELYEKYLIPVIDFSGIDEFVFEWHWKDLRDNGPLLESYMVEFLSDFKIIYPAAFKPNYWTQVIHLIKK